ncbi:hypothetical protein N431DRAFT_475282 [Stipitochalara longipes BDJ]|nr:hypothetical protein N431DRAFT_475282 [Stipitochalara longipes BDJ]
MASLSATPVSNWNNACASIITNANISTGFVGQYGNPMSSFTNITWGIDKNTCDAYCGKDKIYQVFDFNVFANAFTSWLLPWLTLAAQLPFEAKSPVGNLMSLFMAVGSPALITYSLTLAILNRIWVRRVFERLQKKLDDVPETLRHSLRKRLRAAQYLLQESQQVPMRVSQVDGWLSSLIVLDENHAWWMRGRKDLQNTRRGYTFSLLAQIGMAFLAYTLTIAISLNSAPLGSAEGNGVLLTAGGGIWIWMIPVILGWIMCGTQARACSIADALNDQTHPVFRSDMEGRVLQSNVQHGVCSRSGLIPRPRFLGARSTFQPRRGSIGKLNVPERREASGKGEVGSTVSEIEHSLNCGMADTDSFDDEKGVSDITLLEITESHSAPLPIGEFPFDDEHLRLPTCLGFSIEGDEALEGALFNYARLFTFREFCSKITKAFDAHIESLKVGGEQKKGIVEVAAACRLDTVPLQAYNPWREIDASVWHQMLIAAGAAIFTGPAIMIAYLTPTVGLGCRSGGYLLYGIGGTISWALTLCSSLLSHGTSIRYQDIYMGRCNSVSKKENTDLEGASESGQMLPDDRYDQNSDPANLSAHRKTRVHSILVGFTVLIRIAGKSVAFVNACWIVVAAILEYTGVYSNCWCATNADVLGSHSWAVLFATPQSFQTVARNYWIGGIIFSFGVCLVTYVGFFLGCKRSDVDEYDG